MKTKLLALSMITSMSLFSGCNPENTPFLLTSSDFVQSGANFTCNLYIVSVSGGTDIDNIYLSDSVVSSYGAAVTDTQLMGSSTGLSLRTINLSCTNDSAQDTSSHRYFNCKDQDYNSAISSTEHRFEMLLEKGKNIAMEFSASSHTDGILNSILSTTAGTLGN